MQQASCGSFVDAGSAFPADTEALEAVEPSEGALDDPTVGSQASGVSGVAACDRWHETAAADLVAIEVVVVAAVGEQRVLLSAGVHDATRTGSRPPTELVLRN